MQKRMMKISQESWLGKVSQEDPVPEKEKPKESLVKKATKPPSKKSQGSRKKVQRKTKTTKKGDKK